LRFADRLYLAGSYDASLTEYWRFLFFHPEHPHAFYAYYKVGLAQAQLQEWDAAVLSLRRAVQQEAPNEFRHRLRYQLALTLMAKNDFDLARLELFKLIRTDSAGHAGEAATWLYGLLLLYQKNWPEAQAVFARLQQRAVSVELTDDLQQIMDLLQLLKTQPERKSPRLARRLSTFIPGSGQFYAGHFLKGLNALALNAGAGYLAWRALDEDRRRDFALIVLLLWSRYYQGNRLHAAEAAIRTNQRYQENLLTQIYARLQQAGRQVSNTSLRIEWSDLPTP